MRILDHLVQAVRAAAVHNPDVQAAPACILWPDPDRQWETVMASLQAELPELLILGDYAPERQTGPAIWLRCAIAGRVEALSLDNVPILYLPGVGRQDLRAISSCPDALKPLAELQYRGVIWSQVSAKDWTILAFLKSDQGGLGLDVAQDQECKHAMQLGLHRLLDEELSLLKGRRLDKDYFNTLLTGGDPVRDLLLWLDQGEGFKTGRSDNEWQAFVAVCQSQLGFNPHKEGQLAGATQLATRAGPWHAVWDRYGEAPKRYPRIPTTLMQCAMPPADLLADAGSHGSWPQWNASQEEILGKDLLALANLSAHEARSRLLGLEQQHGPRRNLVWAELGMAPLAMALQHLAALAEACKTALNAGEASDLAEGYRHLGWKGDDAALRALAAVDNAGLAPVTAALRAIYLPWLEASANHLQAVVEKNGHLCGSHLTVKMTNYPEGTCLLFVDGLRFDTGKRLAQALLESGHEVVESVVWTPLPSVTATGKAAVTPVHDKIKGELGSTDFEPVVADTGQSLKGGYYLKKLLEDAGWTLLAKSEVGTGQGRAWCEFGDIDHEGHDRGWKLARHLDALLTEVQERIAALLAAGWKQVKVVTDHGWLLIPGGLPKVDLPSVLTESKWGRSASLKPGASTERPLFPWFWNPNQYFVLANGVSCFKQGEEYAHGGLSLQECLTLQLNVTATASSVGAAGLEITDVVWKGLRCTVAVDGQMADLKLDVRAAAGDPATSLVLSVKPFKQNPTASVVIENEDLQGSDAWVVVMDKGGALVAQRATTIGGEA
jgi:hypothetical protein